MKWKEVLKGSCGTQREKQQFEKTGKAKPDFLDLDDDGNKTEPMKDAAENAKKGKKRKGITAKDYRYMKGTDYGLNTSRRKE